MRNLFWACIARLLFKWTWLTERLILKSFDRPHRLQLGDYMGRWWLVPRSWLPFAVRIHHIKRKDNGRHLHNHPGSFRTFILRGWYVEKRGPVFYHHNAGDTALVLKDEFHEIAAVSPNGVITMVIEWGWWKGSDWGFDVDGEYVSHRDYTHYDER